MFCVIQEIQHKKPDQHGHQAELEVYSHEIQGRHKYYWHYTGERFERPILTAYKVSIHESKRVQGVVTKSQHVVTTIGYYDLVDYWIGDCIMPGKLETIAAKLDVSIDSLWDLINAKVDSLQERIQQEFAETPEGKAQAEHRKIIEDYQRHKRMFSKAWGVDADQYDYCYDLYGNVVNQAYIDEIERAATHRERSYYESSSSNYSGYDYSKLFGSSSTTHSAEDKARLKQFYKSLSKIYHPDVNPDADTHAEMVLLNKLKEEWGV